MSAQHYNAANAAWMFGGQAAHEGGRIRQRARRLVLVMTMSLVAAAVGAASATADPIGKIEINGAAPNRDGSGLQVSASMVQQSGVTQSGAFQVAKLTVTNKSSSYTDIKEIDGQVNPVSSTDNPIQAATTISPQDQSQSKRDPTCNATNSGANGLSGSFSCPGLSVPPGQSVNVFMSGTPASNFGACCRSGLASINVIYDSIEVNGNPMNPHGKGLQVTAITTKGSCPGLPSSASCLTVVNSPNSGAPMFDVTMTPNSPPVNQTGAQITNIDTEFFGHGTSDGSCLGIGNGAFDCITPFGIPTQGYSIDFTSASCFTTQGQTQCPFSSGLGDIAVTFQKTPCANTASVGPLLAKVADNCTPPSHTKITQARVNHQKHTAFFRFTAKGTHKFLCELMRNGQRMSYGSCKSPETYANRLPEGQYVFYVAGMNQGGVDSKPARFKFSL